MKIGVVRRGYSATGGAERYLQRFAAAAADAGHECLLFTGRQWPTTEWHGPIVRVDGSSPARFANRLVEAYPGNGCEALFSLDRVRQCDVYRAGDGVHAAWLDRRATFEPRWRTLFRKLRPKHRELLALEEELFAHGGARAIIANSRMVRDEILLRFDRRAEEVHVVYNGVPSFATNPDARARLRRSFGIGDATYVALFAGSGWERKGLRFAIEAIRLVRAAEAELWVAGTGRGQPGAASDRVRFLGTTEKMSELLAAADVFVLPTIYDPFSNACLEAMAAGLPVITTASNGFAEVIEAGVDGEVLKDPGDVRAIGRAIDGWESPERREGVRGRLRAKAAQFSPAKNLNRTLEIILATQPRR